MLPGRPWRSDKGAEGPRHRSRPFRLGRSAGGSFGPCGAVEHEVVEGMTGFRKFCLEHLNKQVAMGRHGGGERMPVGCIEPPFRWASFLNNRSPVAFGGGSVFSGF